MRRAAGRIDGRGGSLGPIVTSATLPSPAADPARGAEPAPGTGPASRPVLALRGVGKTYPNGKVALRDVDLTLGEGEFVFLVGPSGAGKSTLLKLLIRDELPTAGEVIVDGRDLARVARRKVPDLRRRIGIVFQDFKLLPTRSVRENVSFALEVTGTPRGRIRPAVERALAVVGLSAQADQFPTTLSGGEQQRTAIARALVHEPRLIIADEPTGNLDPLISLGDHPAPPPDQRAGRHRPHGDPQRRGRHLAPPARRRAGGGADRPRRGRRLPPRGLRADC